MDLSRDMNLEIWYSDSKSQISETDGILALCFSVQPSENNELVVSTHLKNISQNGNLPQIGVKKKNLWNHQLDKYLYRFLTYPYAK